MTPITLLLRQKPTLCSYALAQTADLNEAHLLVHGVMTNALRLVSGSEQDLAPAMTLALNARADRLAALAASA